MCKGKLFECVHLLTLEFCTVSAESWRLQEKCAQHFQFSDPKLWPVNNQLDLYKKCRFKKKKNQDNETPENFK